MGRLSPESCAPWLFKEITSLWGKRHQHCLKGFSIAPHVPFKRRLCYLMDTAHCGPLFLLPMLSPPRLQAHWLLESPCSPCCHSKDWEEGVRTWVWRTSNKETPLFSTEQASSQFRNGWHGDVFPSPSLFKSARAMAVCCWIPAVLHMVSSLESDLVRRQMNQGTWIL